MKILRLSSLFMMGFLLWGADSPFAGTWKFNSAQSKFTAGGPSIMVATMTISVAGKGLKWTGDNTTGEGVASDSTYESQFDGAPSAVIGSPTADSRLLTRVNEHTLTAVASKDRKVVYTDRIVVSTTGKTMTIQRNGTTPEGKMYQSTIVFDRIK